MTQALLKPKKWALSDWYRSCEISVERIARFTRAVGAQTQLEVVETRCQENPDWAYLCQVRGERCRSPIDRDWMIEALDRLLESPSLPLSRVVWCTMCELPDDRLKACYQKVERYGCHTADSQLVHLLRQAKWIPQKGGNSAVFVQPSEAQRGLLPKGFPFDEGDEWLKAIPLARMNGNNRKKTRKGRRPPGSWGLPTRPHCVTRQWFARLPPEERRRLLDELERKSEVRAS